MLKLNDFKEKLNSVVFMGIGTLLALIAVLLMFAPGVEVMGNIKSSSDVFFNDIGELYLEKGAWPVFVGYMLILVGALIMGIIALPIVNISAKLEKILLFSVIGALVIGAILVLCIAPFCVALNDLPAADWATTKAGPIVAGIFAILAAGCAGVAVAFDW